MKDYSDIINLEHHVSKKRPQMSMDARAGQFAPFAALTGYDEAVKETGRTTEEKIILTEESKELLNNKINYIMNQDYQNIEVTFTYFVEDTKKSGGKYINKKGIIKKIDLTHEYILLYDKTKININDILDIDSEILLKIE